MENFLIDGMAQSMSHWPLDTTLLQTMMSL